MRRYRNKKTGAVIEVYGEVRGKNWEPVADPVSAPEEVKDPYAEIFGADPEAEDLAPVPVEAEPPKPKTSRKGRK